jgi:hypothetical protein
MKAQILFTLAAVVPCLCDAAAPFAKPFILNFYQSEPKQFSWTEDPPSAIDDGSSPNSKDPYYLKHMKWTSPDDPIRHFVWKPDTGSDLVVSLCL